MTMLCYQRYFQTFDSIVVSLESKKIEFSGKNCGNLSSYPPGEDATKHPRTLSPACFPLAPVYEAGGWGGERLQPPIVILCVASSGYRNEATGTTDWEYQDGRHGCCQLPS